MSKWFEVNVEVWKRVLVEVEDDETVEDAVDVTVANELGSKDGQALANSDSPLTGADLARAKRHADETYTL